MSEHARRIDDLSTVHLVGVGGAGMSALARVLVARGATVSGSDIKESRGLAALRALGVRAEVGHRAENLEGAGALVVSSAIPPHNPELQAARAAGIPVLQRAQVLAMLMRERRGVAVAGTHGKTTTTSMIAMAMRHAGLDPTFLIGGDLNETGTNAHHGTGEWLVAEADESDGSFLWLAPDVAVVTNIEADHLDYYRDEDEIRQAFLSFVANVRPGGTVVLCDDDPGSAGIADRIPVTVVRYGIGEGDGWRARVIERGPGGIRAAIARDGEHLGEASLSVAGDHNLRNALAAFAVADLAGVPFETAAEELAVFGGVARRFEFRGLANDITIVDDYAHHPTEIAATLASARERGFDRIVAIFQPHRYSRTEAMGAALGAALAGADLAVVTDVYGAGEQPVPGVTGKRVVDGLLDAVPRARVAYLPLGSDLAGFAARIGRPGDLILTLGAGDITMLADEILDRLRDRSPAVS
ncbi:MAG TPA: UDP-N-acetylmuramate--L-alanine ligase [Actinomycetota bacterium]|nr:UDP-N-acetylmuramate--L-alanine ligase [Actinomycetota bacterium]